MKRMNFPGRKAKRQTEAFARNLLTKPENRKTFRRKQEDK